VHVPIAAKGLDSESAIYPLRVRIICGSRNGGVPERAIASRKVGEKKMGAKKKTRKVLELLLAYTWERIEKGS